ncbi:MAG: penicillin acylase family protein [Armatimonadota bacterium]|nr:penicillin acylase family protein [Armatimonadota bacterium]MDR7427497.1 penicillin acylase family protein [Armatimonadota bacterium]MDR7463635.1 penicillin acylase family protein [Armatimonadota bacterium]MDR7469830.1 penicillin acylase family protein [Armatimonadota bacterium]MDR7475209.1 penicillin acylase family protein [Armatimonadota bacterium]
MCREEVVVRLLRLLAVLGLVVLLLLAGGTVYLVRRPFPQIQGTLILAGLTAPVEVVRDRWGLPHIFAQGARDLFFAQGYVHAQDRLWQMELFRRTSAGRLSELFGPTTLQVDRLMRVVGLRRAAQATWAAAAGDPAMAEAVEAAQAYSEGVNAFISSHRHRLPLEFVILRAQPEPWTPVDSLAFGKLMAWVLGGNWRAEVLRAALVEGFGPEGAEALLPQQFPGAPAILGHAGRRAHRATVAAPTAAPAAGAEPLAGASLLAGSPGTGSNSWVVAPARSASGGALLANDPHLDAQMPSIWHIDHLAGGAYNVIGVAFPGVPGIIIGHNRHIAWGLTNAMEDTQDLYLERFHFADPTLYLFRGRWERARVIREEINVRGRRDPETIHVRLTRHGPILNPAIEGLKGFVALRWAALEPDRLLAALLGVNRASSWEEFRAALRHWSAPAQNVVYADRAGNIGYVMPGRLPRRGAGHDGRLPVPGWSGEYEWQGFLSPQELPALFNPPRGYIVTANNRVAPPDYPHLLGTAYDIGVRALRITSLLEAEPRLDLERMARIQLDQTSPLAQRFVAAWQEVRIGDPDLAALFAEITRWDGRLSADSRPALLYQALLLELLRTLFEETLGSELFRRYLHTQAAVLRLLQLSEDPDDPWWGEGRDRTIEEALRRTVRDLERRLGPDRSRWRWGRVHTLALEHPLGRVRVLAPVFNGPAPATGGDTFTVNVATYDPEMPYRQVVVPSMRLLVDTGNWETARIIHTTGQSGLPFHRHYRDLTALWARGEYIPLLYARPAIAAAAEGVLTLRPP